MALYHTRAEGLKPEVENANFTKEQLTLVLKMMKGCSQLRQGSVIESFFECMIDKTKFKIVEGHEIEGKYGTYRPKVILGIDEELAEPVQTENEKSLDQIKEEGVI